MALVAIALSSTSASGQDTVPRHSSEQMIVEGSELARLHSALDVLRQLPGLNITDDGIEISGLGYAALYIDNRKVTDVSELEHLLAGNVRDVVVLRQPGAEYGKEDPAVIIIHLKKNKTDGLSLENTVNLHLTHKATINEELSLGWKHNAWTIGAFLGWNNVRRTFRRDFFSNTYQDQQLVNENHYSINPDISTSTLTTRINSAYAFHDNHTLSASYSLKDKVKDKTLIPEFSQHNTHPETRHDMALEYSGKFCNWSLDVGNNSYADKADLIMHLQTKNSFYLRNEYYLRTYAKAGTSLLNGRLTFGTEHEYKHMDVDKHDDEFEPEPFTATYYGIHANHPDHTLAFFVSASQKINDWTIQTGLRYEHIYSAYQPCEDDGLMCYLKNYLVGPVTQSTATTTSSSMILIPQLFKDGRLSVKRDFFYPELKVSTRLGESNITLLHTQNSVRPYLGLTRLQLREIELMHEKILWTEKVATTTLGWQWRWVDLQATHRHYQDPICSTLVLMVSYNAPDYDAFDIDLNLTPQVGIWSPMLRARFHKQWFDMPLADGKDKLSKPLFSMQMSNSFNLPKGWLLLVNADLHSRGADRNVYFYRSDFRLDASLQKELPRQGLTFTLAVTNVLRNSYYDVTKYVESFYGISEGVRDHIPRVVLLSVKYKLKNINN